MLTHDNEQCKSTKKVQINCFSGRGVYIGSNLSNQITGDVVLNNMTLIKVRKENPHLNLDGLSQILDIPANLISKVLNLGGTLYKSISKKTGNNYFIFIQNVSCT